MTGGVKWKSHFWVKRPRGIWWAGEQDVGKHRHLYSGGGSAIFGDFPKLAQWSFGKPHPSPKSFQSCWLPLELAGSDSLAPSILCRLPLKAPKTFLPVKAGGADAGVGKRLSRGLEKVTPRLQFPNECRRTGCLNALQLKHNLDC